MAAAHKLAALERRNRERFYIAFSCWDGPPWGGYTGTFRKFAWPILFRTEELALAAAALLNPFQNTDAIPGRGRIKSFTIEKTHLRTRRTA